jgi:hypothetical protein
VSVVGRVYMMVVRRDDVWSVGIGESDGLKTGSRRRWSTVKRGRLSGRCLELAIPIQTSPVRGTWFALTPYFTATRAVEAPASKCLDYPPFVVSYDGRQQLHNAL